MKLLFSDLMGGFKRLGFKVHNNCYKEEIDDYSLVFCDSSINQEAIDYFSNNCKHSIFIGWCCHNINLDVSKLNFIFTTCHTKNPFSSEQKNLCNNVKNFCPLYHRANEDPKLVGTYIKNIEYDWCYIGAPYRFRGETSLFPEKEKFKNYNLHTFDQSKYLSYDERKKIYLSSLVHLAYQGEENIFNGHVSQRVFEGLCYGCIVLSNSKPACEQTNNIVEFVNTLDEVEEKINYYKNNPDEVIKKQNLAYKFIKEYGTNHLSINKFNEKTKELFNVDFLKNKELELFKIRISNDDIKDKKYLPNECDWYYRDGRLHGDVNKQPKTIFIKTEFIEEFYNSYYKKIDKDNTFVVMSGLSDITVPNNMGTRYKSLGMVKNNKKIITEMLKDKRLLHWYAENCDEMLDKFTAIPTGIASGIHYQKDCHDIIQEYYDIELNSPRKIDFGDNINALCCHRIYKFIRNNPDHPRSVVNNLCQNSWKNIVTKKYSIEPTQYLKTITDYTFILCVQGGGIDPSPKAFESILAGCIPIVRKSPGVCHAYKDFPVVFIDEWEENAITEDKLKKWLADLRKYYEDPVLRKEVLLKLSFYYWWNKITNDSNKSQPLVSIAISTYEAGGEGDKLLKHNLDHILKQNYENIEIVISDHSSDKKIKDLCEQYHNKKYSIKYIHNPHHKGNSSQNTNNAIKHCSGEYIKILFMDDYLLNENAITSIVEKFENNNNKKWLVHSYKHTKNYKDFYKLHHPRLSHDIALCNLIGCPSCLTIHKSVKERFCEHLKWYMDCELYKRLFDKYGEPIFIHTKDDEIPYMINLHHANQVTNTSINNKLINKEKCYINNYCELIGMIEPGYTTDKGGFNEIHSYLKEYNKLFKPKRNSATHILEIGVRTGASIKLWSDYFTNANIYGIDVIDPPNLLKTYERVKLFKHNAYDTNFIKREFIDKGLKFDIIIEDGAHTLDTQIFTAIHYPQLLKKDGILIIEDIQEDKHVEDIIKSFKNKKNDNPKLIDIRKNMHEYRYDNMFILYKNNQ